MAELSIVIPTYNRKEMLRRLIKSLGDSNFKDFEIIVVDDCSTDGTSAMIKNEFSDVKFIQHDTVELVGKSRNDGIIASRTNFVLMIDDDNVVDKDTIGVLMEYVNKYPDFAVIAPVTCFYDKPEIIMYAGTRYKKISKMTVPIYHNKIKSAFTDLRIEADGFPNCYLLRKDLAISVGLTSEKIPFGGEDGFLQYKIKMQGRNLYCINHSYVYHDTPELKKLLRVSPFRLYYFMRGKITFAKELYNAKELFLFSFFVPIYFTWYLLRGFSGKSKISCFRAVFCGALDALFNKYDKRYL